MAVYGCFPLTRHYIRIIKWYSYRYTYISLYIFIYIKGRGNGALQMAVDVLRRGADKKLRQFMSIIGSFTCGFEFHLGWGLDWVWVFRWVAENRGNRENRKSPREQAA